MLRELFRTGQTELSDDVLIILDVLFSAPVTSQMLRKRGFEELFNLPPHSLSDTNLKATLDDLVDEGVLQNTENSHNGSGYLSMTETGGSLWSSERSPCWHRFCMDHYPAVIRGRTIMSVAAVSANVRDDFLRLFPEYPARRKRAIVSDRGLIYWHPFEKLHIGLASYSEPNSWTPERIQTRDAHRKLVEAERTWWRDVRELQKFLVG